MLFCRFCFHDLSDDADHEEGLVELVLEPHVSPDLHPIEKVVENVGWKATGGLIINPTFLGKSQHAEHGTVK